MAALVVSWCAGTLILIAVLVAACPVYADDESAVTGVVVDTTMGTLRVKPPDPDAISQVLSSLPESFRSLADMAGATLAFAIRQARDQALNGARPIPPGIRRILQPYFPRKTFELARWNVVDSSRISLESVMAINKDVDAITLDNVVVFPNCAMALTRWDLWAHELVHVLQYANMGIGNFAKVYVGTAGAVLENQAYSWQDYVTRRVRASERQPSMAPAGKAPEPSSCP